MTRRVVAAPLPALLCVLLVQSLCAADERTHRHTQRSITDTALYWPSSDDIIRTLTLKDYNTRIVVIGTTLLGIAAGVIGTFAYLRKRSMMGDALSHATLPGIAMVFLVMGQKQMVPLMLGAAASGIVGVLCVIGLRRFPRIKEDAAIGIVLSVFFGCGMVLFSLIQQMNTGDEAGLGRFIYGKAASMIRGDAALIAICALVVIVACMMLYKEFRLICFDQTYASSQGWPVAAIDIAMMALVVLTTVIGLQAVGLILIVALLIVPAAAARFWTDELSMMVLIAAVFGATSGWLGSTCSALLPRLPAGAVIVVTAGVLFLVSLLFSPHRGIIASMVRAWLLRRRIAHQHLLRAMAEFEEPSDKPTAVHLSELLAKRSWSPQSLRRTIAAAIRRDQLGRIDDSMYTLTATGRVEGRRLLRNHRLWEMYLIKHADIAPSHVDRDADEVEHVLSAEMIEELEQALQQASKIPPSPHHEGVTP